MCSTFKLPLAALVLRAVDRGQLKLGTRLRYSKADIVSHMPVTEAHLNEGSMSVEALAQAAQVYSDNVAANLLLKQLGGPGAFTAFCRELGDSVTRLDRYEPMLNLSAPGDARDTTTPLAMVHLAWLPKRRPFVVAAYYEAPFERTDMHDDDQLVLARVGNLAQQWFTSKAQFNPGPR
jgi:beta-lactamase class A